MKQILVATDGSENGRYALEEAVELAAAAGAKLTIVYVRHAPLPMLGEPVYQRSLSAELRHANETVGDRDRRRAHRGRRGGGRGARRRSGQADRRARAAARRRPDRGRLPWAGRLRRHAARERLARRPAPRRPAGRSSPLAGLLGAGPPDPQRSGVRWRRGSPRRRASPGCAPCSRPGMALASELSLDSLLQRLTELSAELTGARYAALGVHRPERLAPRALHHPRPRRARAQRAIGDPPHGRGILGALITDASPLRLHAIGDDPRSVGFPANHPPMSTFLGVPVLLRGTAYGNLYLTEKEGGGDFTRGGPGAGRAARLAGGRRDRERAAVRVGHALVAAARVADGGQQRDGARDVGRPPARADRGAAARPAGGARSSRSRCRRARSRSGSSPPRASRRTR